MWMGSAELDELELRHRIEAGIEAADELKRRLSQLEREESRERPILRLIKGGAVGAAVWAWVEWLSGYKVAVAVATAAVAFTGGIIADQPHSPGADPPQAIEPPSSVKPSVPPPKTPKATPTPTQRTSPLRTQAPMRIPPPAEPVTTKPTVRPKEKPTVTPTAPRTTAPPPVVSSPVTPTVAVPQVVEVAPPRCTINLLGVRVCLPLG